MAKTTKTKAVEGVPGLAPSPPSPGPVFRTVKHVLTAGEKVELGEALGRKYQELTQAKHERAAAVAACKDREEAIGREVHELARQLANGYDMIEVECEPRKDLAAGRMEYVRLDTGYVVDSRLLLPHEKQASILD